MTSCLHRICVRCPTCCSVDAMHIFGIVYCLDNNDTENPYVFGTSTVFCQIFWSQVESADAKTMDTKDWQFPASWDCRTGTRKTWWGILSIFQGRDTAQLCDPCCPLPSSPSPPASMPYDSSLWLGQRTLSSVFQTEYKIAAGMMTTVGRQERTQGRHVRKESAGQALWKRPESLKCTGSVTGRSLQHPGSKQGSATSETHLVPQKDHSPKYLLWIFQSQIF